MGSTWCFAALVTDSATIRCAANPVTAGTETPVDAGAPQKGDPAESGESHALRAEEDAGEHEPGGTASVDRFPAGGSEPGEPGPEAAAGNRIHPDTPEAGGPDHDGPGPAGAGAGPEEDR